MFDVNIPFCLEADAYTISSNAFASEDAKKLSVYNIINRKSPADAWPDVAQDSRLCFYGLSHYIRSNLTKPITQDDIYQSQLFMERFNAFGGSLPFPIEEWDYILRKCNGYLPIEIKGLDEGSTTFPFVPVVQVSSTVAGLGEFACHIEATLLGMVSKASARLTLCRHFLNKIKEWVRNDTKSNDEEILYSVAQFFCHDFGFRASSTKEEALLLGLTNLLVFNSTDTTSAAFLAWKLGCKPNSAVSILASAHRNVLGYPEEFECHNALLKEVDKCNGKIGSFIPDCYNFLDSVSNNLLKLSDKYNNVTIIPRSDSGNAIDNILFVLNQGRKNLRWMDGNSVTPKSCFETCQAIVDAGFKPTLTGGIGMGGYLVNSCTRDSLSTKYSLCSVNGRPVVKLSDDPGKTTFSGPNFVYRDESGAHVELLNEVNEGQDSNLLQTYYRCDEQGPSYTHLCYEKFSSVQNRTIADFDSLSEFAKKNPQYGLNRETLSPRIIQIQNETIKKHRGVQC
jgi:nicotinamide phosphoribosyltransferase